MAKITVKPLPRSSWHNKSGKESFTRPKSFSVLVDSNTHKYATGLTPEEAEKYSKILGVDLSDTFIADKPHPYWSTHAARIVLPNSMKVYDTSNPVDFIKVANMKASKLVANSFEEWKNGKYPYATHVIYDENVEIEFKAKIIQKKQKATKMLFEMSHEKKCDIIQIILNKNARKTSSSFVDVQMEEIITEHIDEFLNLASNDNAEVRMKAVVLEAIYLNVLTKNNMSINYMGEPVGNTVDDVVKYFLDPNNQQLKATILGKILKNISPKDEKPVVIKTTTMLDANQQKVEEKSTRVETTENKNTETKE